MTVFAGHWTGQFLSPSGSPEPSLSVLVYVHGTTTPATLYTDRTKSAVASNPFTTDGYGNGEFWAVPGDYTLGTIPTLTVTVPLDAGDLIITSLGDYPATTDARYDPIGAAAAALDRPFAGSWIVPYGLSATTNRFTNTLPTGANLYVFASCAIDRLGCEVTTAGASGDVVFLSLYKKTNGSNSYTVVIPEQPTGMDISTTGFKELVVSATLTPGRYIGFLRYVATGAPQFRGRTGMTLAAWPMDALELSSDLGRGGVHPDCIIPNSGAAAPPSPFSLQVSTRTIAPLVYLRAA